MTSTWNGKQKLDRLGINSNQKMYYVYVSILYSLPDDSLQSCCMLEAEESWEASTMTELNIIRGFPSQQLIISECCDNNSLRVPRDSRFLSVPGTQTEEIRSAQRELAALAWHRVAEALQSPGVG